MSKLYNVCDTDHVVITALVLPAGATAAIETHQHLGWAIDHVYTEKTTKEKREWVVMLRACDDIERFGGAIIEPVTTAHD